MSVSLTIDEGSILLYGEKSISPRSCFISARAAVHRSPIPFQADRPCPSVQVEPIGTGRISVADAVYVFPSDTYSSTAESTP